jgi:SRSO17 transposase
MKHYQHTTLEQAEPTLSQIGTWPLSLFQLHARLAPRFARSEPRRHALLYLHAVISDLPRKNGWQIAEHAKHSRPYAMQRLLSHAAWDHDGVRDDLRAFLWQVLSPLDLPAEPAESAAPFPVLVMDESGFPKRGRHSAGVQPQYCGSSGRIENCQVGVFLYDKWNRKTWFYPDVIMQTEGSTKELGMAS